MVAYVPAGYRTCRGRRTHVFCTGSYVWRGMVRSLLMQISLHDHGNLLALRSPRDKHAKLEDLFLSGTLQYSHVGLSSFVRSAALT
jgi:hypothetical protein